MNELAYFQNFLSSKKKKKKKRTYSISNQKLPFHLLLFFNPQLQGNHRIIRNAISNVSIIIQKHARSANLHTAGGETVFHVQKFPFSFSQNVHPKSEVQIFTFFSNPREKRITISLLTYPLRIQKGSERRRFTLISRNEGPPGGGRERILGGTR